MRLHNRRALIKLMAIQNTSARQLAGAAGWKSHSYMNRLIAGHVDTLDAEPATRIAKYLGVNTADLFAPRASTNTRHNTKGRVA